MNRTIHLSAAAARVLVNALVQHGMFYRDLAKKEEIGVLKIAHESAAQSSDALIERFRETGAHEVEKTVSGTLERAVRMGSASLQRVIGNKALNADIRNAAKFDMGYLDDIFRELRPDIQHAPRSAS